MDEIYYNTRETVTVPSFAAMYYAETARSDRKYSAAELEKIFLDGHRRAGGKGFFGSIKSIIEFVDPKNASFTGGYGRNYCANLCDNCFFGKRKLGICGQETKIRSIRRYECFRIIYVRGEIVVVPSRKIQESMTEAIMGNSINKNGNYDKGHLIAARFGGTNCPFNLVAMASSVNRSKGEYYSIEDEIDTLFGSKMKLGHMRVDVEYRYDGLIPYGFHVSAKSHPRCPTSWDLAAWVYNYGQGNSYSQQHTNMGLTDGTYAV